MCKLILITNIPSPYRVPLWDKLKENINLEIICLSKNEKNRQWNVESRPYIKFLKSFHLFFEKRDWALHFSVPFTLFFQLLKKDPDAIIITGYDSLQYWEALFYAKFFKKKKILWSGSTLLSSRSTSIVVTYLKKFFILQFDTYYTYGSQATKYLESFGVSPKKIVTGTNTIDTEYFKKHTSNSNRRDDTVRFLYVGQLIERKGLENTIKAFSKVKYKNWRFVIVGSGSDENKLKSLVKNLNLIDSMDFVGFKQKNEIISYYSQSDIFIMPSYLEVWGLVLNEALASGLFCLASKYAGSSFDLIDDNINGLIIDPKDIDNIALNIEKTFSITTDKKTIKNLFQVSYEKEAKKILEAINKADEK